MIPLQPPKQTDELILMQDVSSMTALSEQKPSVYQKHNLLILPSNNYIAIVECYRVELEVITLL